MYIENTMPKAVKEIERFSEERHVVLRLSRNETALSCADAAQKRVRRGVRGIPLHEEMKSLLCRRKSTCGNTELVALHLRGDHKVDFSKVRKLLSLKKDEDVCFASETDLQHLRMRFGTVNPVHLELRAGGEVYQIFDTALTSSSSTMMTNAGDLMWGMEFFAAELIPAIRNHLIADFSDKGVQRHADMR